MADPQSNAHPRPDAGVPTSGVIHVRTRLNADFTVIANALAQRRGSAVTIGVAAYILSLPDGAPVSIAALCAHFTEGEILISRALRELEAAGYLERRRVRGPDGQVRTRTYFYDVPRGEGPDDPTPPTPRPSRNRRPATTPAPARPLQATPPRDPVPLPALPGNEPEPASAVAPQRETGGSAPGFAGPARETEAPSPAAPAPLTLAEADPRAVAVLATLRIADSRLILSRREVAQLAPAVAQWLAQGVGPEEITQLLTTGLPDHFRARPARILAFRLREVPVTAPAPAATPAKPAVLPWQTCDGCERAFRAAEPDLCRDCRQDEAAHHATARDQEAA